MGKKRRKKFRKVIDAQEQLDQIEEAQRRYRQGRADKKIDSIEKSKQRDKNARKRIRSPEDLAEEFDTEG
jgi:hypothetical protein